MNTTMMASPRVLGNELLSDAGSCTDPAAVGASAAGSEPLVMVLAARCSNCGREANGFHLPGSEWSYLVPFVAEAEWVRNNPTRCKNCGSEDCFLFATKPHDDPYAEVA